MSSLIGRGRQDTYGNPRTSAVGPNAHSVGPAPSAVPNNPNAGTGATASVTPQSNDNSGTVTLNTGGAGLAGGNQVRVNFATPFAVVPSVVFSPADDNAAGVAPNVSVVVDANGFTLRNSSNSLSPNSTYVWNYIVL